MLDYEKLDVYRLTLGCVTTLLRVRVRSRSCARACSRPETPALLTRFHDEPELIGITKVLVHNELSASSISNELMDQGASALAHVAHLDGPCSFNVKAGLVALHPLAHTARTYPR
jgi:hypothetical protein